MRKFIFIALLALSASLSAQPLKWSATYNFDHIGTFGRYIGSINGKNYFETDYYSHGIMAVSLNKLSIFATDNQNNKIAQTKEPIKIPSYSLLNLTVLGDYLYAFYSDKEGVRYKRLDPNTLEETADKLLCTSSGKKTFQEKVIQSGDKSKIALIIKSSKIGRAHV